MKKVTVKAPANIALIKYWGKEDEQLRLPLNASFSMNLSEAYTVTTVEFLETLTEDAIELHDGTFSEIEKQRITIHLDRLRQKARITQFAHVVTCNSFPKGTGIASSASGFAALTVAAASALHLNLSEKELTVLARIGSGSACRSIPDGFVVWEKGTDSASSFAHSVYPPDYWDLRDSICILNTQMKSVSSSGGMEQVTTSPLLPGRLAWVEQALEKITQAFATKNFKVLGETLEADAINMHDVMRTQQPSLLYWQPETVQLIHCVREWRSNGLLVYFTIDAGPNVHLIYEAEHEKQVVEQLQKLNFIKHIITNKPAEGTKVITEHLF